MSSLVLTELHCDAPDCFEFIEATAETAHSTEPRVAKMREIARDEYDWIYTKVGHSMYDLCPECHSKIEKVITQMQNRS